MVLHFSWLQLVINPLWNPLEKAKNRVWLIFWTHSKISKTLRILRSVFSAFRFQIFSCCCKGSIIEALESIESTQERSRNTPQWPQKKSKDFNLD